MILNELTLLSKNDIPFEEGQLIIHQPTLKEIAYLGEENFFMGCGLLNFSKDRFLSTQDKKNTVSQTDFQVLITILTTPYQDERMKLSVQNALFILTMLFPNYEMKLEKDQIVFITKEGIGFINSFNFDKFKEILVDLFCLKQSLEQEYNPTEGALAQQMMEMFRKRREKLSKVKGVQKINILSRYVSILSVGEQKDINTFMNYTIFQLFDEYERYMLKTNFDHYVSARLAGAKDMKEPDNWMDDIHSGRKQEE